VPRLAAYHRSRLLSQLVLHVACVTGRVEPLSITARAIRVGLIGGEVTGWPAYLDGLRQSLLLVGGIEWRLGIGWLRELLVGRIANVLSRVAASVPERLAAVVEGNCHEPDKGNYEDDGSRGGSSIVCAA
jgi:hypothetical protein